MWPGVSIVQLYCRILWYTKYLEGINWYLRFFVGSCTLNEGSFWGYTFVWVRLGVPLVQLDPRILWSSISRKKISCYLCLTIVILSFFSFVFLHLLSNSGWVHLVMTVLLSFTGLILSWIVNELQSFLLLLHWKIFASFFFSTNILSFIIYFIISQKSFVSNKWFN